MKKINQKIVTFWSVGFLIPALLFTSLIRSGSEKLVNSESIIAEDSEARVEINFSAQDQKTTHTDDVLGISFDYPTVWGDVMVEKEMGIDYRVVDPVEENEEVAYMLSFSNFEENFWEGKFLTANRGEDYGPIAREGSWGDYSDGLTEENIESWCDTHEQLRLSDNCEIIFNENEIKMIKQQDAVDFMAEGPVTTQYFFPNSHGIYSSIGLSPSLIVNFNSIELSLIEKEFEQMIQSIRFIN